MVLHLVRAWSTYKDKDVLTSSHTHTHARTHARTHAHTHTHTHRVQIHALLVMGWYNERKENDRSVYAEEKRRVFNFDLKRESEDECLTERGREFQITGPMY